MQESQTSSPFPFYLENAHLTYSTCFLCDFLGVYMHFHASIMPSEFLLDFLCFLRVVNALEFVQRFLMSFSQPILLRPISLSDWVQFYSSSLNVHYSNKYPVACLPEISSSGMVINFYNFICRFPADYT